MTDNFRTKIEKAVGSLDHPTMAEIWEAMRKSQLSAFVTVWKGKRLVFEEHIKKNEWRQKTLPPNIQELSPARININATIKHRNVIWFDIEDQKP